MHLELLNDGAGGKPTAGQLLAVAAGVGVATALGYGVYRLLQYRATQQPPSEWHRVGEVSDLWIYPIKSCGAVRVRQFQCSPIGPQVGFLRDRIFMVVKSADGKFITGRSHPTITAKCTADRLQFAGDYKAIRRHLTEICG